MSLIILQSEQEKLNGVRYEFDSNEPPIGEGGMGRVFKGVCINERNGYRRPVAVKFMYSDLPANIYERARREASIRLRNDNLVEMLGFIETQEQFNDGHVAMHYHVVSELLTGVSLSDILEGKTKDRNGVDVPYAVKLLQDYKNDPDHFAQTIVMNVLSGLMALHDAGYIHRDIDPTNIMVTADGHIKLIDFGIAKQMKSLTTSDKALTVAGKFMGKPEYAAPELALGDIAHQNQTTDIYAMGILLYQCILGHTPFEGSRYEILEMQIKQKMPLSKIKNKALRNIIAMACEKRQELRYQTSSQMRVALENINGAKPSMSPKKKFTLVGIAFAIILVLVGIILLLNNNQDVGQDAAQLEAENRKAEQIQEETLGMLNSKIDEADNLFQKGASKTSEEYEQDLMNAINLIIDAEELASQNPECGYSIEDLETRKDEYIDSLKSASIDFERAYKTLENNEETDLAQEYKNRIMKVEEYLNSISK